MKTSLKIVACLLFLGVAEIGLAQQSTTPAAKQTSKKMAKRTSKKGKDVDNKIAVSDQAQPADKGTKKQAAQKKAVTNK